MTSLLSLVPPGTVCAFAGLNIPTGWLLCDGSAISRRTFKELFTYTGTTYGVGDGTTTFNVPNLINRIIVGTHSNPPSQPEFGRVGTPSGANSITLVAANLPSHTHLMISTGDSHNHGGTTFTTNHGHGSTLFNHSHSFYWWRQNKVTTGTAKIYRMQGTSDVFSNLSQTNNGAFTATSTNFVNGGTVVPPNVNVTVTLDAGSAATPVDVRQPVTSMRYIIKF